MAKAAPRHNSSELQTPSETGTDEVEKSLELLDKVLSEFEEEQENTQAAEPESPSQGHQSEDDGYMSMNGRRAKFVPDFLPTEEAATASHSTLASPTSVTTKVHPGNVPHNEKFSPPTPEEAERIISNLLPHISPSTTQEDLNISAMPCIEFKFNNNINNNNSILTSNLSFGTKFSSNIESEASSTLNSLVSTNVPLQTTLPKTRPATVFPSRYASLPSSTQKPIESDQHQPGNIYIGRDFIGIRINDVHNAVLKSGARMPETIVNEHPVTIYPGPLPQKRVPPRTLPGSIERHREVCRKNSSSELSSPSSQELQSPIKELTSPMKSTNKINNNNCCSNNNNISNNGFILENDDFIKRPKSPTSIGNSPTDAAATQLGIKISIQTMDNLMNNRNIMKMEQRMNMKNNHNKRNSQLSDNELDDDEDKFSDDSLEDTSLPPPAPPPIVVPPPPSLSAPVTPSKRHSIAWEVNLDDLCSNSNGISTKVIGKRQGNKLVPGSESQSQSSICSTPGQSSASNKISSDWPDPPDIPICSTEDEAASIYSDSEDVIPPGTDISDGNATYIIRKGRRRQRIDEFGSISMSSINSKLSNEALCREDSTSNVALNVPSPIYPPSMMMPNSRHSIDLGASPRKHILHQHNYHQPNIISNSPRSRLSLDLNSPNTNITAIDLPKLATTPTTSSTTSTTIIKSPSVTKITTPTSPMVANSAPFPSRYTEFKTYSSTFDGLQALESHASNGSNNIIVNGNRVSPQVNNNTSPDNNPLMRVSSLPALPPQNQLTGDSTSTPRRELAPPIEEDSEEDSDGTRGAPLRQIENNISALLRGDIAVAQVASTRPSRPLGFRPGVHKSESAKEMLLSQQYFGPLPATPPSSSPDDFPPLPHTPPSPGEAILSHGIQNISISSRGRMKSSDHGYRKEHRAPAVPPHAAQHSYELKTRSMDAGFSKSYRNGSLPMSSPHSPGRTLPPDLPSNTSSSSRRRLASSGFPKRSAQSPREERRLQTSCSLPETPIFARGCDIPRGTPHRRAPDPPGSCGSSRTNPRQNSLNSSSIVGIGCTTIGSTGRPHRSINHALQANGELMRMSGLPARGWYPKQRHTRTTASTEHLDRLHQGSLRAWEMNTGGKRKPTTLPPNMTPPKFFNKSPRDALRRVTSLLINRKGNSSSKEKEKDSSKREKVKEREEMFVPVTSHVIHRSPRSLGDIEPPPPPPKKKGFFKSFWKKSRHYSLEQN